MAKAALAHLAQPGAQFELRVTPKSRRNEIREDGSLLRVAVTAAPEDGKANTAVQKLLAKALGVPKSRLELVRGATSRDKLFRLEE